MIELKVSELAEVCGGKLIGGNMQTSFKGVCTDSRKIEPGQLFFALKGENFDGHDFVYQAFLRGAAAAVVHKSVKGIPEGKCVVMVEDTLLALQKLAAWWRKQFDIPVIGVTGSSGKTTTKDILAGILASSGEVCSTKGNLNNHIGLPLVLLGLSRSCRFCVLEMAMRGLGEIAQLCEIAAPTGGIITNIGLAHYERLGSQENIARAKGELAQSLPEEGFLLLNSEDPWSSFIRRLTSAEVIYYGMRDNAHIRAEKVKFTPWGSSFLLVTDSFSGTLDLPLPGKHNLYNCLAAVGAAVQLGLNLEEIRQGLKRINLTKMRLEHLKGIKDTVVINDAYNANPDSMKASLKVLRDFSGNRKIAVLGDMLELGEIAVKEHIEVGRETADLGIDYLITVGKLARNIAQGAADVGMSREKIFCASNNEEAVEMIKKIIVPGDVILVKGSRAMGMEEIVNALRDAGE
ncbi:MAG TPA: UDP-N-acetylmuramoyl-tripeptide--D-alanyl-D-alanine ligase [Peptococcaceae bacterium]|nr:MAG: UDP-N-acetylmuramoyl-tripeptide--D-alanyl-D-alanine ligase [Clostridia bacterium 41_269]HBT20115.1 UDP-N-acetylmuramoyl-tripeptide--D-alanyl-D-alanine ligase [Peptococcaceae bacterium]